MNALIVHGAIHRDNYMTDQVQNKPKLFFVFPEGTPQVELDSFDATQLQITPAMYQTHNLVISNAPGTQTDEFLNKVGPGAYSINNIQNLMMLETVFGQINQCLRSRKFQGAVDLLVHSDNPDGSKSVTITQCFTMKPELNDHNFFFKIFVKTNPFTAYISQESGKLVVDQETLDQITVAEVLEPELYLTDKHGTIYHPETFFKMRSHGVRNPIFNLDSDVLQRGVLQALKNDQAAWLTFVRAAVPQILDKTVIEPISA